MSHTHAESVVEREVSLKQLLHAGRLSRKLATPARSFAEWDYLATDFEAASFASSF